MTNVGFLDFIMANLKGVSVIICTYNGKEVIGETLKYLFKQKIDNHLYWEIIVVDNNSNDNTAHIAQEIWNQSSNEVSFKILNQPIAGKINALKKGLATAKYEFILICDDDNFLEENYVQTAYNIISNNPQVGFLGGYGHAKTDIELPGWFGDYEEYYGCGKQSRDGCDITYAKEYVYGAGSVFRKSIFDALNEDIYFRSLPGRKNNNHVGAEDNLMAYVAVIMGYKIWYSDELNFHHKIKTDRLEWNYLLNLNNSNGRAEIYLKPYTDYIRNNVEPKWWIAKVWIIIKHILSILKHNGFGVIKEKEGCESQARLYYYLGKLQELVKLNFSYRKEYTKSIEYCKIAERKSKDSVA